MGKKTVKTKMSLNDFLSDAPKPSSGVYSAGPSPKWGDSAEIALPSAPAARFDEVDEGGEKIGGAFARMGYSEQRGGGGGRYGDEERAPREPAPIPDVAPFKIFVGNLDRNCTEQDIIEFFEGLEVLRFNAVTDRETQQFRGFGYVEFATRDQLLAALEMNGRQLLGRGTRIDVAAQSDRDTQQNDERTNRAWRTGGSANTFADNAQPERPTNSAWRRNDAPSNDKYESRGGGDRYGSRAGGDRYGGGDRYSSGDKYGSGDRYESRGWGGRSGGSDSRGDGGYQSRGDGGERPKLNIAPRTKPVTPIEVSSSEPMERKSTAASNAAPAQANNPFGSAKPIDTAAKEAEIEKRLEDKRQKDREALEAKKAQADAETPKYRPPTPSTKTEESIDETIAAVSELSVKDE
eukprot:CFRG1518T1